MLNDWLNEERLEHSKAESAVVHTPSSPVRERERKRVGERERKKERERGREREKEKEGGRQRERMQYTQSLQLDN